MSYTSTIHDSEFMRSEIYMALIKNIPIMPTKNSKALNLEFVYASTRNTMHSVIANELSDYKHKIIDLKNQFDNAEFKRNSIYDSASSVNFKI